MVVVPKYLLTMSASFVTVVPESPLQIVPSTPRLSHGRQPAASPLAVVPEVVNQSPFHGSAVNQRVITPAPSPFINFSHSECFMLWQPECSIGILPQLRYNS